MKRQNHKSVEITTEKENGYVLQDIIRKYKSYFICIARESRDHLVLRL